MPTTPNGTPYTVFTANLGVHGDCYWGVADAVAADADIPLMVFAHGTGGAANTFSTGSSNSATRSMVIDNGLAYVEGTGGITNNWGNQAARDAYVAYINHVTSILSIGLKIANGRSMGNLVAMWLATQSGQTFDGLITNFGVGTMKVGEPPGVSGTRPTAYNWRNEIAVAYGITGSVDGTTSWFNQIPDEFCPETWPATVWAGLNILSRYGGADTTVPWGVRGVGPIKDIWSGQPAMDLVSVFETDTHSSPTANADVTDIANFLLTLTGGTVEPEPPATYERIISEWLYVDGKLYASSPPPMEVPPS